MVLRVNGKLACAINAKLNVVNPDPPFKNNRFLMQYMVKYDPKYNRYISDRNNDYYLVLKQIHNKTKMRFETHH